MLERRSFFLIIMFLSANFLLAQRSRGSNEPFLGLDRFGDSQRHWYRINDQEKTILPKNDQKQYKKYQIKEISNNILLFQKENGGWAKNYDMIAILDDDQILAVKNSKDMTNTTFDNGTIHSQVSYLAEVYSITRESKYLKAFNNGLKFVLKAQYKNGGWPQLTGYRKHITYNDMAMIETMKLLQKITYNYPEYDFIDSETKKLVEESYRKGLDCIIKTQIIENGVKKAWCQQHDSETLKPVEARSFEKASICNYESAEIVKLLMAVRNPNDGVIDAVHSAVAWFEHSQILGIRQEWIIKDDEDFIYHSTNRDRIVVEDPEVPRMWARFNELETNKPIFCGRDGIVKYSMTEIDRDRRTGYGWYTYAPEEVMSLYKFWKISLTRSVSRF